MGCIHLVDVRAREDVNRTAERAVRIERIDNMARGGVDANGLGKRRSGKRRHEECDQGQPFGAHVGSDIPDPGRPQHGATDWPMHRLPVLLAILASVSISIAAHAQQPRVLVFSKTAGFRHSSIPNGIAAIRKLGQENGFAVDATEDAGAFTQKSLARYSAVVFLSTTGDVLNPAQQDVFERYIQAGGGYVGVHSATDTEYDWPWYGRLAGADFNGHPGNPHLGQSSYPRPHTTPLSTKGVPPPLQAGDEVVNI